MPERRGGTPGVAAAERGRRGYLRYLPGHRQRRSLAPPRRAGTENAQGKRSGSSRDRRGDSRGGRSRAVEVGKLRIEYRLSGPLYTGPGGAFEQGEESS